MKPRFTNFGYHQLIEKRDINLDHHIRKPRILRILDIFYVLVLLVLIILSISMLDEMNTLIWSGITTTATLILVSVYLSGIESHRLRLSYQIMTLSALLTSSHLIFIKSYIAFATVSILLLAQLLYFLYSPAIGKYIKWAKNGE